MGRINWFYEKEILEAVEREHDCVKAKFDLMEIEKISEQGEMTKFTPVVKKYVATLICKKCYSTLDVNYTYSCSEKIDFFDVDSVKMKD